MSEAKNDKLFEDDIYIRFKKESAHEYNKNLDLLEKDSKTWESRIDEETLQDEDITKIQESLDFFEKQLNNEMAGIKVAEDKVKKVRLRYEKLKKRFFDVKLTFSRVSDSRYHSRIKDSMTDSSILKCVTHGPLNEAARGIYNYIQNIYAEEGYDSNYLSGYNEFNSTVKLRCLFQDKLRNQELEKLLEGFSFNKMILLLRWIEAHFHKHKEDNELDSVHLDWLHEVRSMALKTITINIDGVYRNV